MPQLKHEHISVHDGITLKHESDYLIVSNKQNCQRLLENSPLEQGHIIDIFISLHIVLEAGLNTLFRHITLTSFKKMVDEFKVIENIDNINFIDKTILFIYNSKFDFSGKEQQAREYHSIIGKLRKFSGIRNSLLHGHSISTINNNGNVEHSKLKRNINLDYLKVHIKEFKDILEGVSFYLDCLDSDIPSSQKDVWKKTYLDTGFLPQLRNGA